MNPWEIFAKRELILIMTKDEETGKENIMPARWCTRCSNEPPLIAVSIGLTRYTHELLDKNKYFAIAVPDKDFDYSFIGSHSGRDIDKFEGGEIERIYGKYKVPLIKRALLNIELEKYESFRTGDHTLFVGEFLEFY
jgi:flavin reductase (DIM6/NTAB) family NADH-FMN oxidoreductase RutF